MIRKYGFTIFFKDGKKRVLSEIVAFEIVQGKLFFAEKRRDITREKLITHRLWLNLDDIREIKGVMLDNFESAREFLDWRKGRDQEKKGGEISN